MTSFTRCPDNHDFHGMSTNDKYHSILAKEAVPRKRSPHQRYIMTSYESARKISFINKKYMSKYAKRILEKAEALILLLGNEW